MVPITCVRSSPFLRQVSLLLCVFAAPIFTLRAQINMPVGSVPIAIDMKPVTNKVYVNDANSNTVAVIDGAANSTITSSEPARSKPKNLP